jgi:hypothetical protein
MLPVTFSRELYFLVEPKTYCFSTIFYQLDNVNEDIRLQLLRDLNWSFNPSNDLQRHQLYKYLATTEQSYQKQIHEIISRFKNPAFIDKFTFIAEFVIDPNDPIIKKFSDDYHLGHVGRTQINVKSTLESPCKATVTYCGEIHGVDTGQISLPFIVIHNYS